MKRGWVQGVMVGVLVALLTVLTVAADRPNATDYTVSPITYYDNIYQWFGTDGDFRWRFNSSTGYLELTDAAAAALASITPDGDLSVTGSIDGCYTKIEFTPAPGATGYYRIGQAADLFSARVRVVADYDGRTVDGEFFAQAAKGGNGAIQQIRWAMPLSITGLIDKARVSGDGTNAYLDINVFSATTPDTITVYIESDGDFVPDLTPAFNPTVGGTWNKERTFSAAYGIITSGNSSLEGTLAVGGTIGGYSIITSSKGTTDASTNFIAEDTTAQAAGVGGAIGFKGRYIDANTTQTAAGLIRASKSNATSGNYDFDLLFKVRQNGVADPVQALKLGANLGATFAGTVTTTQFRLSALNTAPANASDTGTLGEIRVVDGYIYVCTATNTWKRAAIATW